MLDLANEEGSQIDYIGKCSRVTGKRRSATDLRPVFGASLCAGDLDLRARRGRQRPRRDRPLDKTKCAGVIVRRAQKQCRCATIAIRDGAPQ